MTTLVTGFEPFGGAPVNASELVVRALAARGDCNVRTAVLPTSYRRAESLMTEIVRTLRPQHLLMLGLAGRRSGLILEQVARNRDDCTSPDNDGEVRRNRCIVPGAPALYPSTLPLGEMARIARSHGEDVLFSRDAGGYICNHLFFTASNLLAAELPGCAYGFVHLPPLEPASERLERIVLILRRWVAGLSQGERPGGGVAGYNF